MQANDARLVQKAMDNAATKKQQELVSLILTSIGSVLASFGAGLLWGAGGCIGILGVATFILGVLIGKD